MIRHLFASLALAAVTAAGFAQDNGDEEFVPASSLEELEERLASIVADNDLVGVSLALADRDGVYWRGAYGYSDLDNGTEMTVDTPLRAGSISKSVTSLLAMQAVEDGLISLDDLVTDLVPHIAISNHFAETDPVRLVHLLEHTAGWDDIHMKEYGNFPESVTLRQGLIDHPNSRTSRWAPGRFMSYANAGPAVAGHVLETLHDEEFESLAQTGVFQPLGMSSATFGQSPSDFEQISRSYTDPDTPYPPTRIYAGPSGSMAVTAGDLAQLGRLYLNRGRVGDVQLLSEASIDRIERPMTTLAARQGVQTGYGLGNFTSQHDGALYHGHNGAIDGFVAELGYRIDAGETFVILQNTPDGSAITAIRRELVGWIHARHPAPEPLAAIDGVDLEAYAGWYRQITPRNAMFTPLGNVADNVFVRVEDDHLVVSSDFGQTDAHLYPVGSHQFAREGNSVPSLSFTEVGGELYLGIPLAGTYAPDSQLAVMTPALLFAALVLAAVLIIVFFLIWGIGRLAGAFRTSNRWRVWTWPILGFLALLTLFVALIGTLSGGLSGMVTAFSGPSPAALTIMASSIAAAVFSLLAIWSLVRSPDVSWGARIPAGLVTLIVAGFSTWLAMVGWIGIRVWDYVPAVTGV